MADAVSGILQKQLSGNFGGSEKMAQNAGQNGQSFESVMQNGNNPQTDSINQFGKLSDPNMEQLRVSLMQNRQLQVPAAQKADLINRVNSVPPGQPNVIAVMPEFLDTKTKMINFNEIFKKASEANGAIGKNGFSDMFTGIEKQYAGVMGMLNGGKDMSQGELLVMQARLYQVSQHIDVLSKVVDQMTSGVKTVLNTNI